MRTDVCTTCTIAHVNVTINICNYEHYDDIWKQYAAIKISLRILYLWRKVQGQGQFGRSTNKNSSDLVAIFSLHMRKKNTTFEWHRRK